MGREFTQGLVWTWTHSPTGNSHTGHSSVFCFFLLCWTSCLCLSYISNLSLTLSTRLPFSLRPRGEQSVIFILTVHPSFLFPSPLLSQSLSPSLYLFSLPPFLHLPTSIPFPTFPPLSPTVAFPSVFLLVYFITFFLPPSLRFYFNSLLIIIFPFSFLDVLLFTLHTLSRSALSILPCPSQHSCFLSIPFTSLFLLTHSYPVQSLLTPPPLSLSLGVAPCALHLAVYYFLSASLPTQLAHTNSRTRELPINAVLKRL